MIEDITNPVIGCAIEVHRQLGPGLLESTYERCLLYELGCKNIEALCQVVLPIQYKNMKIDAGYRLDILVPDKLIVEIKAVEAILPVHVAQLLTYMKLTKIKYGLLLNFNVSQLKQGIKRMIL